MKALLGTLVLMTALTSTAMAYEEQHVTCTSLSGRTQVKIDETNRPDLELAQFDSQSPANSDEYGVITSTISVDGKEIKASRIQVLSATEGNGAKDVLSDDGNGKQCRVGYTVDGIAMKANITLGGKVRLLKLQCKTEASVPQGAVECN